MTLYEVTYRTRLEGWENSVHVIAGSPYEAFRQVSDSEGRPIPVSVFPTNEADYGK